jgi:hypothetical protein
MIKNGQQSVTGTATMIDGRTTKYSRLYIHNNDNTKDLFIGNSNVTANNGYKVLKLESIEIDLPPLNDVFVVSDGNAHTISWLRVEID